MTFVTVAVGYVSLRLEGPAFLEFHALLAAAKQQLEQEPAAVPPIGVGCLLAGLH